MFEALFDADPKFKSYFKFMKDGQVADKSALRVCVHQLDDRCKGPPGARL